MVEKEEVLKLSFLTLLNDGVSLQNLRGVETDLKVIMVTTE